MEDYQSRRLICDCDGDTVHTLKFAKDICVDELFCCNLICIFIFLSFIFYFLFFALDAYMRLE